MKLITPHIALGESLANAFEQLRAYAPPVEEEDGSERCFRIDAPSFRLAIYPDAERVGSVWYDDPIGRGHTEHMAEKVKLYLERYGPMNHWELRMDNGWMHYWFNPTDRAAMVYGIHKDVLRFNTYAGDV